jgi:TP901 family phage tail tape measure protein
MAAKKDIKIVVGADVQQAITGLNSVGKSITRIGQNFTSFGKATGAVFDPLMRGVRNLTLAMGALVAASLKIGGDFEAQMKVVQSVTLGTADDLEKLEKAAREIGANLPVSAKEAAQGMEALARAGMSTNEILAASKDVTALSIAQNYGLAETAELVTAAIRGFGLEAEDAGRVTDVFATACSTSMLNMEKLSIGMGQVAPIFSAMGYSIEETVAMMGKLADAGLESSTIAAGMKTAYARLSTPSAEAQRALNRLGVEIYDVNGKMKSAQEIFGQLAKAGMTTADAFTIFGTRGAVVANVLAKASGGLDEYTETLKRTGTTQEQVNIQMESFANKVKALRSIIEENFINVFDAIGASAGSFVDTLTGIFKAFDEWADATGVWKEAVAGFGEGLGLAGNAMDTETFREAFRGMGSAVRAVSGAFQAFAQMVPWEFLAKHIGLITKTIITGWAVGKTSLIIGTISHLGTAFGTLAKTAKTAYLALGLGTAASTTAGVGGLTAAVASLQAAFAGLAATLGPLVAVGGALYMAYKAFKGLSESMSESEKAAQAATVAFDETGESLEKLTKIELAKGIEDLEKRIASLRESLQTGIGTGLLGDLGKSKELEEMEAALSKYQARLNSLDASKIQETGQAAAQAVAEASTAAGESLSDALTVSADITPLEKALGDIVAAAEAASEEMRVAISRGVTPEIAKEDFTKSVMGVVSDAANTIGGSQGANLLAAAMRKLGQETGQAYLSEMAATLDGSADLTKKAVEEQKKAFDAFLDMRKQLAEEEKAELEKKKAEYQTAMEAVADGTMQIVRETAEAITVSYDVGGQTFQRTIEKVIDVQEEYDRAMKEIHSGTRGLVSETMESIVTLTEKNGEAVYESFAKPLSKIPDVIQGTGTDLLERYNKILGLVKDGTVKISEETANTISVVWETASGEIERSYEKPKLAADEFFTATKTAAGELSVEIHNLSDNFSGISENFAAWGDSVSQAFTTISETAKPSVESAEQLGESFERLPEQVGKAAETFEKVSPEIQAHLKAAAEKANELTESMGKKLVDSVTESKQAIASMAVAFEEIKESAASVAKALTEIDFSGFMENFSKTMSSGMESFVSRFNSYLENMTRMAALQGAAAGTAYVNAWNTQMARLKKASGSSGSGGGISMEELTYEANR